MNSKLQGRQNKISARSYASWAMWASVLAAVGDFMMLCVANSGREELGFPQVATWWLWPGGILGVIAIPFYAFGYYAASQIIAKLSRISARIMLVIGVIGSLLGAVVHGLSAVHIHADITAGIPAGDPAAAMLNWGPSFLTMLGVVIIMMVFLSGLFAYCAARGVPGVSRLVAFGNPILIIVCLSFVGQLTPLFRSFVPLAAPNVAHIVFFWVCAHILRSLPENK